MYRGRVFWYRRWPWFAPGWRRGAPLCGMIEEVFEGKNWRGGVIRALLAALQMRDTSTESHSRRVVDYSLQLGQEMGLSAPDLVILRDGALLHDIGKIGIPDAVLLKPGSLTREEWEIIKRHPEIGYHILRSIGSDSFDSVAEVVLSHHERWDGNGYPRRLRGNDIPIQARIFAVADAFDAMRSDRPYRKALSLETATQELQRARGLQFDPEIVDLFLSIFGTYDPDIRTERHDFPETINGHTHQKRSPSGGRVVTARMSCS